MPPPPTRNNNSGGGWDDELFLEEPSEILRCPICYLIMRDAVQCPQQHAFCRPCAWMEPFPCV
jgi:hypothetical protein